MIANSAFLAAMMLLVALFVVGGELASWRLTRSCSSAGISG